MEPITSFGYWLRRRRKALDLTQDALARQAGCALGTLKKIETDERRPSRQLAERLADCLALPTAERAAFVHAARAELATDQLTIAAPAIEATATERLPGGTVTFLFTDIEGSTALWQRHAKAMPAALARHEAIVRQVIAARGGVVFKTIGDAVCAAFASAPQALAAALDAQRALHAEPWDAFAQLEDSQSPIELRVRMALHTGTAELHAGEYAGFALSRVARILTAGHGGQVLLSQSTYELVRNHRSPEAALRDLGAHRLKDLNLPERIFQLVAPGVLAEFPPLRTVDTRLHNLPAQPTALIGREREIATVGDLLRRDDVRLLTLTGPGGTGKTRLAAQAVTELALTPSPAPVATGAGSQSSSPPRLPQRERASGGEGRFPDGIFFVNLAPISDPNLVATTIAHTLGLVETADKPIEARLRAFLESKQLLLLLDNFEQVLDAAPLVADLLAAAAGLKVLVTSRATLHLYGEHEFSVPPLALPPLPLALAWERGAGGEGDLTQYEAVRLFIARARAAKADFTVTNANAPAVAEICHRLDGLPLAIELAAARIKQFAPETLLTRLGSRLQVLTGGPRDLPTRQQTLRNTIDWSYNLLDESEQALFRRLGVFVGGCTPAAAAVLSSEFQVLSSDQPNLELKTQNSELDILDGLAALVNQSLLRQEEGLDGEPRFVMLETVREYALERLAANNELEEMRRRHAEYFMALAEAAEPVLKGHQMVAWLDRLEAELDNIRAALSWGLKSGEVETTARLDAALCRFWDLRDYLPEAVTRLETALTHSDALPPAVRAKTFAVMGKLLLTLEFRVHDKQSQALWTASLALYRALNDQQGIANVLADMGWAAAAGSDTGKAMPLLEESLALFRALDDNYGSAWALLWLGVAASDERNYPVAQMHLTESLAHARAAGDQWSIAWALCMLGANASEQGDYATARAFHEERLEVERALKHKQGISASLLSLGQIAQAQQDYTAAYTFYEQSLTLWEEIRADAAFVETCFFMGNLAFEQGDYAIAHSWYDKTLTLARDSGDRLGAAWSLINLASVAWQQGDSPRATTCFTESLAICRELEYKQGIAQCLRGFVGLASESRKAVYAARLCGAIEVVEQSSDSFHPSQPLKDRIHYDRTIAAIRAQLDEATFAAAWAEGRQMTLEEAIAEALDGTAVADGSALDAAESSM
jgi:predicted ATPase/class 3 adenylate cyclase